jgi:hypothetical protein
MTTLCCTVQMQGSPGGSQPRPAGPTFRPIRNMSMLQRPLSGSAMPHNPEETVPLLDISMNNRVQHRPRYGCRSSG